MRHFIVILAAAAMIGCAGMSEGRRSQVSNALDCPIVDDAARAACRLACAQQSKVDQEICTNLCYLIASQTKCMVQDQIR